MFINITLIISSIENSRYHPVKTSKNKHENLHIFMSDFKEYVCCSDVNDLIFGNDKYYPIHCRSWILSKILQMTRLFIIVSSGQDLGYC